MKNLKEKISSDFMIAFKNKEMDKKNFLGLIKGEIQLQEGRGVESTDENVLNVLKKLEKSLTQNNDENSKKELEYLFPYMPKKMSGEEIRSVIDSLIESGVDNLGQIMSKFNKDFKGKADNKLVSQIAKETLN